MHHLYGAVQLIAIAVVVTAAGLLSRDYWRRTAPIDPPTLQLRNVRVLENPPRLFDQEEVA